MVKNLLKSKVFQDKFKVLRNLYQGPHLLIVSNSAGTDDDPRDKEAKQLEMMTGAKVFRHSTKKPGCGPEVFEYLRNASKKTKCPVKHPKQVAVIGDRLFTDVMMANMMGAWSIWVKDGVVKNNGFVGLTGTVSETELTDRSSHVWKKGCRIA